MLRLAPQPTPPSSPGPHPGPNLHVFPERTVTAGPSIHGPSGVTDDVLESRHLAEPHQRPLRSCFTLGSEPSASATRSGQSRVLSSPMPAALHVKWGFLMYIRTKEAEPSCSHYFLKQMHSLTLALFKALRNKPVCPRRPSWAVQACFHP